MKVRSINFIKDMNEVLDLFKIEKKVNITQYHGVLKWQNLTLFGEGEYISTILIISLTIIYKHTLTKYREYIHICSIINV